MLRAVFGFVGLLVVLAIVGPLAKKQLQALGTADATTTRVHAAPGGSPAAGGTRSDAFGATAAGEPPSAQQQIQGVQQSVVDRTHNALQQGVERSRRAEP